MTAFKYFTRLRECYVGKKLLTRENILISATYGMVGGSARLRAEVIAFNLSVFLLIYISFHSATKSQDCLFRQL